LYGYAVQSVAVAIEQWINTAFLFNTVVMVNTLAHCYDADKVFLVIRRILKPGGVLVFHEKAQLYDPRDSYDVGHPLALTQAALDTFLSEFEPMYRNGDYFIGRKA
jgi:SAM-dependent methyltransferase